LEKENWGGEGFLQQRSIVRGTHFPDKRKFPPDGVTVQRGKSGGSFLGDPQVEKIRRSERGYSQEKVKNRMTKKGLGKGLSTEARRKI